MLLLVLDNLSINNHDFENSIVLTIALSIIIYNLYLRDRNIRYIPIRCLFNIYTVRGRFLYLTMGSPSYFV